MKSSVWCSAVACFVFSGTYIFGQTTPPSLEDISEQNVYGQWQGRSQSASSKSGYFVDLNFLYLRPDIGNLSAGMEVQATQVVSLDEGLTVSVDPLDLNFNFDPGLSAGIGYIFQHRQQWELSGYWTYFHSTASTSLKTPLSDSHFIQVSWLPFLLGPTAKQVRADWIVNYNLMDVALSRHAFFGSHLSLKPRLGIRAAWINQDYQTKYNRARFQFIDNGANVSIYRNTKFVSSNDFWGVGVRAGSDIQWHLNKYMSVVGNLFASLLYGQFDVKQLFDGAIPIDGGAGPVLLPEIVTQERNFNALRPTLESSTELLWQRFYRNESYRLTIGINYQLAFWFEQNVMFDEYAIQSRVPLNNAQTVLTDNVNVSLLQQRGNLQLQGLRAHLRFDF